MNDISELSCVERSLLLYAETCVVDHGGLLEAARMNREDIAALENYQEHGVLTFGRIPFYMVEEIESGHWKPTHWVTFTDRAWAMAHGLRRHIAETRTSATRNKVDAALTTRDINA
jgi:hypothetical protein